MPRYVPKYRYGGYSPVHRVPQDHPSFLSCPSFRVDLAHRVDLKNTNNKTMKRACYIYLKYPQTLSQRENEHNFSKKNIRIAISPPCFTTARYKKLNLFKKTLDKLFDPSEMLL